MSPSKDDPPSAPKIAIKGFSLSAKPKSSSSSSNKPGAKPTPPSSLGKRPRSTFAHDSDSDSESERKHGKHEVVTGFGEEGAVTRDERKEKGPLVIPKLGNTRHFQTGGERNKGQGKKNLLPPEVQAQMAAEERERLGQGGGEEKVEGVDVVNGEEGEKKWGLSVRKKETVETAEGETTVVEEIKETEVVETKPKSADDEALQALLGNGEKKGPDLIIPQHETEEATYRRAIESAPDASTLEDYERVPVEEFGAALLRGMGWDGKQDKSKVKEVKRRQNLLGLGAKELQGAEELGAWVQKTDTKRLKPTGSEGRRDRRPKVSEYKREKERRDERREEKGGGSYRRERERDERRGGDRDGYRDRDGHRDRRR
jgi:hypothetical protein